MSYMGTKRSEGPGFVAAETTVFFFLPNSTIEGAQLTLLSPNPGSRVANLDVLVCKRTTRLLISRCIINQGKTLCTTAAEDTANSPFGGTQPYLRGRPLNVAALLSASPIWVTAFGNEVLRAFKAMLHLSQSQLIRCCTSSFFGCSAGYGR